MNETLNRLYEQHAAALLLYARVWCRVPDDALQEAFIDLSRRTELPPDPVAWLYKVVRFKAINLNRGEQRRKKREQEVASSKERFFVAESQGVIDSAELEQALKKLHQDQREIVVARIWGELTFEQIAELNGDSSSTVHRRYRAALAKLKLSLDGIPCREVGHE